MKRSGLVFVPREPPKRVILYPTQDSTSQQQLQQTNGSTTRAKTALVTNGNNNHATVQQSNNDLRLSRQQPTSSLPNGISKLTEKSENEKPMANLAGQSKTVSAGQNPYHGNPFFRPKPVANQSQPWATTTVTNGNLPPTPPSRETSTVVTGLSAQTLTSGSTTVVNRGRPPVILKAQNPIVSSNGKTQESEITADTAPTQEDNRRWAHTVASAPAVRRTAIDERPNIPFKLSETNIPNPLNNDSLKQKVSSATDIVISLMDTWRAPINPGSSSITNIFTRTGIVRDDSAIASQTLTTGDQITSAPPFLTVGPSSTGSNNQNWKKALVANFQKNSRNNPTAKLFTSKQTNVPVQPSPSISNDTTTTNQQPKPERTMILNGLNNERTFQLNENTPSIPSLIRKSTESLRVIRQDNNNTVERSTSLQIQSTTYSNPVPATTVNKLEEPVQPIEVITIPENAPIIPIPAALITAKPPASAEQQRAIITRVMIRRDFVKSTESRPAIPAAMGFRSMIPPQSAKPGGLPTNNVIQVATITENSNLINTNIIGNRIYPFQTSQSAQQQSGPLSQKSLLAFASANPANKELYRNEINQQQFNGLTNDPLTSSSIMKIQQSQIMTNNGSAVRSNSLSAANAESKRKKDELTNKLKKRATSASAVPNDE